MFLLNRIIVELLVGIQKMKKLLLSLSLIFSTSVFADWHGGTIDMVAIGYDGKTISVGQTGSTKTDCTCYSTWPNRYCLDRTRNDWGQVFNCQVV